MEPNVPPLEEDKTVYETLLQDGLIKKVTRVVPWFSKLQLIDVAFKVRSFKEDSFFAQSQFYRENLRRGLSFIHEENLGTFICRRGLQKFFDLRVEYFDVLDGTIPIDGAKIPKVEKALYNVIFDEVTRVLNEGGKVTVYKTEKANGENAQVSYNKKHDAWIVASKNVSMMLRNRADIEEYKRTGEEGKTEGRYSVAIMIAQAWFNILEKSGKGEELKKEMSNKTLVGEYCGHPDYQHLVTYKNITIFFFAMVDIHGKRSCHPMNETFTFLKKYDLPIVKIEARRECSNIKELIGVLHELTTEVAQSTIEEDAEGSVIYFEGNMDGRFEILSLCKVKTLEYRLYRKLREKLKTTIGKDKSIADVLSKYKSESEALAKGYKTPKPLSHYHDVAALALNFVKDNIDKAKDLKLTHRYLDFLNVILACQKAGMLPSLAHFKTLLESADNFSESEEEEGEGEENA